jgi:hypothetical protein
MTSRAPRGVRRKLLRDAPKELCAREVSSARAVSFGMKMKLCIYATNMNLE